MRLKEEFRTRTKPFASQIIRVYVQLPKVREEVGDLGKQLLRSGTSVAAPAGTFALDVRGSSDFGRDTRGAMSVPRFPVAPLHAALDGAAHRPYLIWLK